MRHVRGVAIVVLFCVLTTSCSEANREAFRAEETTSTSPQRPSAARRDGPGIDPCATVDASEVAAALDVPIGDRFTGPTVLAAPGAAGVAGRVCDFRLARNSAAGARVRVASGGAQRVFARLAKVAAGLVPARGIGDEALWQEVGATIWLRVGDRVATVQVVLATPGRRRPAAEQLAAIVAERL